MGLFGKKQTDDCEDLGEALAQTNSGRREVELVIGEEKVGTTTGTKPYYNDKE